MGVVRGLEVSEVEEEGIRANRRKFRPGVLR